MPEKESVISVPQKMVAIEKPVPEKKEVPVEPLLAAEPELEVEMLTLHLDTIGSEMKLLASANKANLPVKRFHKGSFCFFRPLAHEKLHGGNHNAQR